MEWKSESWFSTIDELLEDLRGGRSAHVLRPLFVFRKKTGPDSEHFNAYPPRCTQIILGFFGNFSAKNDEFVDYVA